MVVKGLERAMEVSEEDSFVSADDGGDGRRLIIKDLDSEPTHEDAISSAVGHPGDAVLGVVEGVVGRRHLDVIKGGRRGDLHGHSFELVCELLSHWKEQAVIVCHHGLDGEVQKVDDGL